MLVSEVLDMKGRRVVTIDPEASVRDAVGRLVQHNVGSLPVVDAEGRLIGVVSERDVIRLIHREGESAAERRISTVMTCNPVTCRTDDLVDEVMGLMSERRIAKVPVVEDGALVGVVSVGDVIKVMYDKVSSENRHLMSYIHGDV